MKKTLLGILPILPILALSIGATAQNVDIPDANFKAYLVGNPSINTNMDSEIQLTEANSFNGAISCGGLNINDLTGIEEFYSIPVLFCNTNNLTSLDVTQNTALTALYCYGNSINSIDLSQNTALTQLDISNNNLNTLNVIQNTVLDRIYCHYNNLSVLNVSQNSVVTQIYFNDNNLSTIDVSQNPNLTSLHCNSNDLTYIDVSSNTSLTQLICYNNQLTGLNLKNLNPSGLTTFNATTNPNLTCIEVDDVSVATTGWTNIDPASSFSLNCIILVGSITVAGQAGSTQITTNAGTLQMVADVLPANADDVTYSWSVADGTGSASIDASGILTAMTNGTVTVTATANDASGETGNAVITISNQSSAGINDNAALSNVSVYPNPAKTQVTVAAEEEVKSIVFINLMGETVKTIVSPTKSIDVSDLSKGIYMMHLQFENSSVIQKLIKE